ncbi:ABC transporter ATP-binding protein [Desertihabitans brevis]|uniref:ABC transporter ATP-binding protein n=1 Tax=Desertihabitans brevis TaxID=2268447 RepID=A0A367YUU1_9ACTN|nr:ABC transporter ATP-binding protein [Desertihabitans brevis]RCK69570.1 ABC transporter ATP-binding protein [Desertihabitans brevis]
MDAVVVTEGLIKRLGSVRALDGLDLVVRPGEVHGLLGPNGAGKSTTLRVLLGHWRADGGHATVLGLDPWRDGVEVRRHLAYVPGDVTLWPQLTGGEAVDLLTRLRGGDVGDRERLLEAFQLDPRKRCRTYSKGNRQKVALVAAFATPADLYVLDEPTSGLDPLMERVFAEEVHRVAERGATVLLSSHLLAEVEQLCDRVTIVRAGRVVDSGSLAELRHLSATRVSYTGVLRPELAVDDLEQQGGRTTFSVGAELLPRVLAWLAAQPVDNLTISPPSLEELFLRHYGPSEAARPRHALDDPAAPPRRASRPRRRRPEVRG